MNCPFYGCAFIAKQPDPPFVLFSVGGNRCALITGAHAPCQMEIAGETPDWKTCPFVKDVRCEVRS